MTTTRHCVTCGIAITVTARNPNRRYCSPRCRKAAWQAGNRRIPNSVANDVADVADGVHDVADAVPAANGVTRCPHCRQDVAVIAVVIPADAAYIRTPEVIT
jgi:endogenous inhibitor of DNA gyrase (YacG/DUF329 family)